MKKLAGYKYYVIIVLAVIAVYANTFKHGFVLDDDVVFRQNKFVQEGVTAIPDILTHGFLFGFNQKNDQSYRPLVLIDFAISKTVFGNNPHAHHKVNVFYYALLCCLLFYFLHLLFNKNQPWLAFWISLLYALHPVHTEVVANIKGRDEILHAIFLLFSFVYALKYIDLKRLNFLLISLVTYFLALLCKEMAVTYILLLPLTIWFFREIKLLHLSKKMLPYLGVLIAYFIVRNLVLDTIAFDEKMSVLNNGIAAAGSFSERFATTVYIFANYIKLLFFPHPLTWDYSYPHFQVVSISNIVVLITIITTLILGVLSLLKMNTKNIFAYTFLFFIISFSIVSNFFILIGATLGERFLFFPSIAFCIFIVFAFKALYQRNRLSKSKALPITIVLICAFYSFKTIDRNKEWATNYELFKAGAIATPNNTRAISAIGSMNRELGEQSRNPVEAKAYFDKAIAAYKKSIELLPTNADSYYNLGVVYMNTNQNNLAKQNFAKTIELQPNNINGLNNLGVIYFREQNFNEALNLFGRALKANPNFQSAYANVGAVYHNLGNTIKAKEFYLKALELNPNDINTRNNLNKLN